MAETVIEGLDITYDQLLAISSGVDADRKPRATISLDVLQADPSAEDGLKEIFSHVFENAVTEVYSSGGCAVIEVSFPKFATTEYNKFMNALNSGMDKLNEEDDVLLYVYLMPLLYGGKVTLSYKDIVYYTGYQTEDKSTLILCFNNLETEIYTNDDIDFDKIAMETESELIAEQNRLDEEIDEAEEELQKASDVNIYEESVAKHIANANTFVGITRTEEEDPDNKALDSYSDLRRDSTGKGTGMESDVRITEE